MGTVCYLQPGVPASDSSVLAFKMAKLQDFHGKWKEIKSENDSPFMKALGIGKTKRRIAKRLTLKLELRVKNDKQYTYIHKLFNRVDDVTLGIREKRDAEMGKGYAEANIVGNQVVIHYEIIETAKAMFATKLPPGAELNNTLEIIDGNLVISTTYNGVTIRKTMKKRDAGEADDVDDESTLKEFREAANDED